MYQNAAFARILSSLLIGSHVLILVECQTDSPNAPLEEHSGWRWKTIMVIVALVFWVLTYIIALAVSIPRLLEDRKIKKAKIDARKRALSFKKKDPKQIEEMQSMRQPLLSSNPQRPTSGYENPPPGPGRRLSRETDYENGFGMDNYNPRPAVPPHGNQFTGAIRYAPDGLNDHLDRIASHQVQINHQLPPETSYKGYYRPDPEDEFSERDYDPPSLGFDNNQSTAHYRINQY